MILNKPKRLIAIVNGFEVGIESPFEKQDAAEFDAFCEAFKVEVNKFVKKPEPMVANEAVS